MAKRISQINSEVLGELKPRNWNVAGIIRRDKRTIFGVLDWKHKCQNKRQKIDNRKIYVSKITVSNVKKSDSKSKYIGLKKEPTTPLFTKPKSL